MFRKAKQSRIFEDVIEQIQDAILSGKLKVGDQLPCERNLKDEFNISRGTLREGLRVLEQMGLIEIKTGVNGGCIVKAVTSEKISESLALLIRYKKVSLQDLAEFRIGIEGDICFIAAQRATAEDLGRLKVLLAKLTTSYKYGVGNWDSFVQIHEQIHLAIAETTHNLLYISVLQMIFHNIHAYFGAFLPREKILMREDLQDSKDLIAEIEGGRGEEARRIVQEHIRKFSRYMERANTIQMPDRIGGHVARVATRI